MQVSSKLFTLWESVRSRLEAQSQRGRAGVGTSVESAGREAHFNLALGEPSGRERGLGSIPVPGGSWSQGYALTHYLVFTFLIAHITLRCLFLLC